MTKAELINGIAIKTGLDKRTIGMVLEGIVKGIKGSLKEGENVYLRGFGSFVLKTRNAKVARNIRSKTTVKVPEHSIPSFKPAAEFRAEVRNVKKVVRNVKKK